MEDELVLETAPGEPVYEVRAFVESRVHDFAVGGHIIPPAPGIDPEEKVRSWRKHVPPLWADRVRAFEPDPDDRSTEIGTGTSGESEHDSLSLECGTHPSARRVKAYLGVRDLSRIFQETIGGERSRT